MSEQPDRITEVKEYIEELFGKEESTMHQVKNNCIQSNLPQIHVPSHVGKLISVIVQIKKPKNVLEIGTLGGYSTIWIAKALRQDAKITTIDINPQNLAIAKENAKIAGIEDKIVFLEGDALIILQEMVKSKMQKYDLFFIDADKENYSNYLSLIKEIATDEAVVLSDNLIPKWKKIGSPHPKDQMAKAIYQYNHQIATDPALTTAIVSTLVGEVPRIDGLGVSIIKSNRF
jgi:predicted O-methyltransferase YrrM